jgi:hypothetical protein
MSEAAPQFWGQPMSEAEWLAATDPRWMLFTAKASERKYTLFAIACCRRIWHLITDQRSRTAVEVAERHAGGLTKMRERRTATREALSAEDEWRGAEDWPKFNAAFAARLSVSCRGGDFYGPADAANAAGYAVELAGERPKQTEHLAQIALARDIFGLLPFRPIAVEPTWLTSAVVGIAESVYADRAFDRMPILADALQDAGCENEDILTHCRSEGPHVRGCWVIDLLLGKQ